MQGELWGEVKTTRAVITLQEIENNKEKKCNYLLIK